MMLNKQKNCFPCPVPQCIHNVDSRSADRQYLELVTVPLDIEVQHSCSLIPGGADVTVARATAEASNANHYRAEMHAV